MARTSIMAARRAEPTATLIVVTDDGPLPKNYPSVIQLRVGFDEPRMPIMLANLEAQIAALSYAQGHECRQITFLDTDTILLKPIDQKDAAGIVNFTWRDHVMVDDDGEKVAGFAKRMPYNYGVVVAWPSLSALEVFIWMRERIRAMHPTHQQWYGNQIAAAEFAGAAPKAGIDVVSRRIPWRLTQFGKVITVGKLPCETYNYTPQKLDEDVSGKYVLHFKGKRRPLMPYYADRFDLPWTLPRQEIPKEEDLATVTAL